ncbi:RING finger domain-containing protein [Histoplasma capsulatum G186AR]|uniref:RING finger domain-containing protein n=2 Tax=Ajellomyces capsulatus TaxID=5037 RepID=C0NU25_AJECG|nr:RING finger domain-containing protein [Histoplasma capsulatum G186AR]EEH04905.1 RING finger domain-containing protein [Histoplasma capsulatum G186AR]KAG5287560.1 RING finger domain-containing protein [Histoplasma capsulatum]QSS70626.1 RING finger domain-containing protein [Histoplasma capsulatum G186AR]
MASLPPQSPAGRQLPSASHQISDSASSANSGEPPQSETDSSLHTNASVERLDVFPNVSKASGVREIEPVQQLPDTSPQQEQSGQQNQEPSIMDNSSPDGIQQSAPIETPTVISEPRKCWICYTDETEDTPLNTEWRSPCPCALTAHEACLLDWLADLENPNSRKRNRHPAKMLCPQCKSEIVISRPRSLVVDLVRAVERLAGRLVLPGMICTLAGTLWAGCCAHGVYSVYLTFGSDDAKRIFQSRNESTWNPRLNIGLPLIPVVLILSRTKYAEGLLPAIPVLFFATHQPGSQELEMDFWPPSAAMTFAALPYVKSFYSMIYERVFGKLEKRWIAEVQPRSGEAGADGQQDGDRGGAADGGNGDILMEIDLELQVGLGGGGNDDIDNMPVVPGAGGEDLPDDGAAAQNQEAGGAEQGNQILGRRQEAIIHDTSNIADTVLGALLFPVISASMGGVLKMALPKAWTTVPSVATSSSPILEASRYGLLQSRWGRSVVGGCLFVLLKDALVLYCRWKLANTHRKRKVLNYDRTKKQAAGRGESK